MKLTALEASSRFGAKLIGDGNFLIDGVGDPKTATKSQICFVAFEKYLPAVGECPAIAWIISPELFERVEGAVKSRKVFLLSENPFLTFVKVVHYFVPPLKATGKIHPAAVIDPSAEVHPSAQVDAFACIEAGVKVGRGVILHSGVWLGKGSSVGEESILFAGVKLYPECVVGRRGILHSGVVIGSDGFGFLKEKNGQNVKVPQVGRAVLGDDVEIGANSTVDRGTLDDTYIGDGTKIDNLVQIGHNCRLGKNNLICAMVGLSGHTTMGDNCLVAGHAGTKGHLTIGNNVQIGAQSGVSKDLPSNSDVKGYPARPLKEFLKNQVLLLKMPEIYRRLLELEKLVKDLSQNEGT